MCALHGSCGGGKTRALKAGSGNSPLNTTGSSCSYSADSDPASSKGYVGTSNRVQIDIELPTAAA